MVDIVEVEVKNLASKAKISQVIWNRLQLHRREADAEGSFKLTKVEADIVNQLNQRLFERAQRSELFLHRGEGKKFEDFIDSSVARVRDFPSSICIPSNRQGIP